MDSYIAKKMNGDISGNMPMAAAAGLPLMIGLMNVATWIVAMLLLNTKNISDHSKLDGRVLPDLIFALSRWIMIIMALLAWLSGKAVGGAFMLVVFTLSAICSVTHLWNESFDRLEKIGLGSREYPAEYSKAFLLMWVSPVFLYFFLVFIFSWLDPYLDKVMEMESLRWAFEQARVGFLDPAAHILKTYIQDGRFGSGFLESTLLALMKFGPAVLAMLALMWFIRMWMIYGIDNAAKLALARNPEVILPLFVKHVCKGNLKSLDSLNCPNPVPGCINKIISYATFSIPAQTFMVVGWTILMTVAGMFVLNAWYLIKTGWGWLFG